MLEDQTYFGMGIGTIKLFMKQNWTALINVKH